MRKYLSIILASAVLGVSLLANNQTYASGPAYGGIAVSPAIQQINLMPGQTSYSFNATVTNNTKTSVSGQVLTRDFTALNDSGGVNFLNNTSAIHGLAKWLTPSLSQFDLPPYGSQVISISIASAGSLAYGGHYGAVIYKVLPNSVSGKANQLSTAEEVSTLVFLTTATGGTTTVSLAKPDLNSVVVKLPTSVNLVFTNTGNTQTSPVGLVTITKGSKEVGRGIINVDSGLVLPSTQRLYEVALRQEVGSLFPGVYKLRITYQASASSPQFTYTKSFIYLSQTLIVLVVLVIILTMVIVIRWFGRPKATSKT